MGSITLTKAKGIWRTLPAPLLGAATLLAVLALPPTLAPFGGALMISGWLLHAYDRLRARW